jgi:hypothetical protein
MQPITIHGIAPVVARAILDEPKKGSRFPQHGQNLLGNRQIIPLVSGTHIINMPRLSLLNDMLDRCAVILNGKPITPVSAVSVEW